jgi:hypothetical protein
MVTMVLMNGIGILIQAAQAMQEILSFFLKSTEQNILRCTQIMVSAAIPLG